MSIVVRLFAAAAEAAGTEHTTAVATTETELKRELAERYGADFARILARCSLMSGGSLVAAGGALPDGAMVDVLPPFAGG